MEIEIRSWKTSDAEDLAKALNNKRVQDNLRDGLPFPYTEKDAAEYIELTQNVKKDESYFWAITVDDMAVGSIGAFRKDNVHCLTAEIGYYIAEEFWGRGIGRTALKKAVSYLFDNTNLVRIFAEPYADNAGSCHILEKTGFVFEGTLRKNAIKNGEIKDMKMYALIKGE